MCIINNVKLICKDIIFILIIKKEKPYIAMLYFIIFAI